MRLDDQYGQNPGRCAHCRDSKTPVIDTEKYLTHDQIDGRLYICQSCAIEFGQFVGMVTVDQADELKARAAAAEAERDELRGRIEAIGVRVTEAVAESVANLTQEIPA